jgi:hypothetical protein
MLATIASSSTFAADVNQLEAYIDEVMRAGTLQLCREPFFPPGECRPARFTTGMRYHWIHSSDAQSNENLALIHDAQSSGTRAIFRSTIPGYGPMRINGIADDVWCMPEHRVEQSERFHARIAGFSEHESRNRRRSRASYGLYLVSASETQCQHLLARGRQLLD